MTAGFLIEEQKEKTVYGIIMLCVIVGIFLWFVKSVSPPVYWSIFAIVLAIVFHELGHFGYAYFITEHKPRIEFSADKKGNYSLKTIVADATYDRWDRFWFIFCGMAAGFVSLFLWEGITFGFAVIMYLFGLRGDIITIGRLVLKID